EGERLAAGLVVHDGGERSALGVEPDGALDVEERATRARVPAPFSAREEGERRGNDRVVTRRRGGRGGHGGRDGLREPGGDGRRGRGRTEAEEALHRAPRLEQLRGDVVPQAHAIRPPVGSPLADVALLRVP